MKTILVTLLVIAILPLSAVLAAAELQGPHGRSRAEGVPILLYHRFGPEIADSMTVTTSYFESH